MKTKILSATVNPFLVMCIAAKTCYSAKSPIDIIPKDSVDFVMKVLKSGHLSIAEHVNFTIAIEGISRACSQQLTRHRHCTFSMQSQRYVDMGNPEMIMPNLPDNGSKEKVGSILNAIRDTYNFLTSCGVKKEDARCILPNCTSCNLVMTTNLRELMHMANLRMCSRSQSEIRKLFMMIKKDIKENYDERIAQLLIPQCEVLKYCPEHNSCGRYIGEKNNGITND